MSQLKLIMGKPQIKIEPKATPRRRNSLSKTNAPGKIIKILSRPASSTTTSTTVTASTKAFINQTANVRVVVRVRPSTDKENGDNYRNVINVIDDQMLIFDPKDDSQPFFFHGVQQKQTSNLLKRANKNQNFIFDKVFDNSSNNLDVFMNSTKNLINTLMNGYNCSVFAYGATGAGKTYTMIGTEQSPGITYLTMKDLFKQKDELSNEREFELMVTYIEVYNELVKDLLNPGQPLNLREDSKYGVVIAGVKGHKINNPNELFTLLEQGNKRRTQHPTDANSESSRSHAVFQVYIQMTMKATREIRRAKLSMIDLAGSERGSATGFVGARFKEGANINKSLLALGNCINSLADGKRHVPYRDSKLTRLLKDSLGGNCHTIMIANISPSSLSFDDTYNTLKYATRAKSIKANLKKNIVNVDMHVDQYIKLVDDLQVENRTLKTEKSNLQIEIEKLKETIENTANQVINQDDKSAEVKDIQSTFIVSPESETSSNVVDLTLKNLIDEQKALLERKFQLQSATLAMSLKRQLKIESNKRLSTIYVDTNDKNEAHRKLDEQIDRSVKKEIVTENQTKEIEEKCNEIDKKLQEFLENNQQLNEQYKFSKMEVKLLEYEYENKLRQKELSILLDDNKEKCNILERMANLMKPVYMAIGGPQNAPESVKNDYRKLIDYFQGKRNLSWLSDPDLNDCITDSDTDNQNTVSGNDNDQNKETNENLNNITHIIPKSASKRKMECYDSGTSLDSTYTILEKEKNQSKSSNNGKNINSNIVAKASQHLAPKRLACGLSPRSKANNNKRLNTGTMSRFATPSITNSNLKNIKATKLITRPRFKN